MRVRFRSLVAAALAAASVTISAAPGDAVVPPLPVGSGKWASDHVTQSDGCAKPRAGVDCVIDAYSTLRRTGNQTCVAVTLVVASDPNCDIHFSANLAVTGAGGGSSGPLLGDDMDYEITTGACAGLTLSGANVQVHDPYMGDWVVHPRVVVTSGSWTIEGNLVSFHAPSGTIVVLHVVAKIKPGCTRVRVRSGQTELKFHGAFTGTYEFV